MTFFGIIINTLTLVLLIILAVSIIILFLYYGLFYLRIGIRKEKKTSENNKNLPGVSVVLTVKNESEQLKKKLGLPSRTRLPQLRGYSNKPRIARPYKVYSSNLPRQLLKP